MEDPTTRSGAPFPTTHISVVELAAHPDSPDYRSAWETFFTGYYSPLYAYLRRTGSPAVDAQDLIQTFFLEGLSGKWIRDYDPARGRLRTFLLACLKNLRLKDHRRAATQPDAGAVRLFAAEGIEVTLADGHGEDPERAFEGDWARQVLSRAIAALRSQLAEDRDERSLRILDEWVLSAERAAGHEVAESMAVTPGDLRIRATRLRLRLAAEIESQVRTYSPGAANAGEERDEVLRCLALAQ